MNIAARHQEYDDIKAEIARLRVVLARLRVVLEEFADAEHHQPPVPLWISMKARKALANE